MTPRASLNASLLLAACWCSCVSRPDGAYTPEGRIEEPSVGDFSSDAGAAASDAGPRAGLPRSGGIVGTDDEQAVPVAMRDLLKLTGRYALARKMHSVAQVEQGFVRLEVQNTTTHLSVAEIALDPETGTLNMTERLCYQRYEHTCVEGCTSWSTEVDARVTRFFPYVERNLTVSDQSIQSDIALEGLGYDGSAQKLPKDDDDERVWNVSGDQKVREGVLTRLHAEGTPLGAIDCVVYTVQKFSSSFAAKLKRGKLDDVTADLDTTGSEARRLGAAGQNASSCQGDSGAAAPGTVPNTLRFTRIPLDRFSEDAFWNCPDASELEP